MGDRRVRGKKRQQRQEIKEWVTEGTKNERISRQKSQETEDTRVKKWKMRTAESGDKRVGEEESEDGRVWRQKSQEKSEDSRVKSWKTGDRRVRRQKSEEMKDRR